MRSLLAAALLVLSLTPALAQTQSPHLEYLEVEGSGFADPADVVAKGRIMRWLSRTPRATAHKGSAFGMTVRPVGHPQGDDVSLRWVWKVPKPGVKDEKTGKLVRQVVDEVPAKLGTSVEHHWEFRDGGDIVRGNWCAEVWNGQRRLAVRRFAIK